MAKDKKKRKRDDGSADSAASKSKKRKSSGPAISAGPQEAGPPATASVSAQQATHDDNPWTSEPAPSDEVPPTDPPRTNEEPVKAKKKKTKSKVAEKETSHLDAIEEHDAADAPDADHTANGEPLAAGSTSRFVVFVGNLPFSATKEQVQEHFASLKPSSIRIMTDRNTKKPKGFAFVEFGKFDRMQTCLKKFNHSLFPDGNKGRKINVELTAGGGGNTAARREKIQHKNDRLNNQRENARLKRDEIKSKQQERQEKKEARHNDKKPEAEDHVDSRPEGAGEHQGMHPARLAQLQANAPRKSAVRF